jgi:hypothetical protein
MPMSERLKEQEIHDGATCRAGSAGTPPARSFEIQRDLK